MADPLADLSSRGVSIWLDDLSRERLVTGSLADMIARNHVVGVTTNPTIFAKAISRGDAYAEQVRDLWARGAIVGEALRAMTAFDASWRELGDQIAARLRRPSGASGASGEESRA